MIGLQYDTKNKQTKQIQKTNKQTKHDQLFYSHQPLYKVGMIMERPLLMDWKDSVVSDEADRQTAQQDGQVRIRTMDLLVSPPPREGGEGTHMKEQYGYVRRSKPPFRLSGRSSDPQFHFDPVLKTPVF